MAEQPFAELFECANVDAIDVMFGELYLAVLAAVRHGPARPPSLPRQAIASARNWAYQAKMTLRERAACRLATPPTAADFLLWSRDFTHANVLVPVARALASQGAKCQWLACQPRAVEELLSCGVQTAYTVAAWPEVARAARRAGAQRARELSRTQHWNLPDFDEVPGSNLEHPLRDAICTMLPIVAEAVANSQEALRRVQPKALIVGNDLTIEGRAGCRVAETQGVRTAVFMHGSISGIPTQSHHCTDRIFVFGEFHRHELLERGIPDQRIVVCGDPKLDDRQRQTGKIHPQLKTRFGLSDGAPWILVATSGPGHRVSHRHHAQIVAGLFDLARAVPEVPIVVKLHRKDRLEYYQSRLDSAADSRVQVVPFGTPGLPSDIFDWLQGCSLVLTGASTTATEAMVMDVPVVTMDYCGELYHIDFIDAGATVHVTTPAELVAAVPDVLASGRLPDATAARMQEFLKGTFGALDGKSSERAASSLRELAGIAP